MGARRYGIFLRVLNSKLTSERIEESALALTLKMEKCVE